MAAENSSRTSTASAGPTCFNEAAAHGRGKPTFADAAAATADALQ